MNKKLSECLKSRLEQANIDYENIEEDAVNVSEYCKPDSIDFIGFNHAINDMLEYIAVKQKGIDTKTIDWVSNYKLMINTLENEYKSGNLDSYIKEEFLVTIKKLLKVLKPGHNMVFNNYVFQEQVNFGASLELYESFIPMVREWIKSSDMAVSFNTFEDFDDKTWLFLQKN